jgi:hypothetical protein
MKSTRHLVLYLAASCMWFIFGYQALTRPNYHTNPPKMQPPAVAYTYFGIGLLWIIIVLVVFFIKKRREAKK